MPRKPSPPPTPPPDSRPAIDRDLQALSVRERRAFRFALGGLPLPEALSRAGFRDPLSVVRLLGSPRFAGALQRAAPLLIRDPEHRRALLAPLLAAAAVQVASDPKASGATRLAAAREADALLRGASGSPGGPAAPGGGVPGERPRSGGAPPGPGAAGDSARWAALRRAADERRAAARARLAGGTSSTPPASGPPAEELGEEPDPAASADEAGAA